MNAQTMIVMYRTGFYGCMALAILSLITAVLMYFKFDIPNIWRIRTGRAKRETIEQMTRESRSEGRMRKDEARKESGVQGAAHPEQDGNSTRTAELVENGEATQVLQAEPCPAAAAPKAFGGTQELAAEPGETTLLTNQPLETEEPPAFVVTQEIMLIHSDKTIE